MFGQQVIFELDGQLFGLSSMKVTSVEAGVQLHTVPGAPANLCGFANFRGEFVPVCDLFRKFNLRGRQSANPQTIFVMTDTGTVGCLVDAVNEIGAVGEDLQAELPTIVRMDSTSYAAGIIRHKGNLITVINENNLLTPEEKEQIEKLLRAQREAEAHEAELKAAEAAAGQETSADEA